MDSARQAALSRLQWLHFVRLACAVFGIVAILVLESGRAGEIKQPYSYAYDVLTVGIALDLVYLLACRAIDDLRGMIVVEIAVDILLESALIYFTGGVDSIFAYLYFLTVLSAAIMISPRASLLCASASTVLLSGIMVAYFVAMSNDARLPLVDPQILVRVTRRLQFILPYLFIFSLSLHIVGLLAGKMAGELKEARILTGEILQTMSGGVIAVDRGGSVAFVNGPARYLLGIPEERAVEGVSFKTLLDPVRHEPLYSSFQGLVSVAQDAQFPARDGRLVWVSVESALLRGERGEPRGVVAILDDITLRRELETLTARTERLQAAQELAAGVAHEIRNPLASIRGAIQGLSEGLRLAGDDAKLMEIILRESDRLNRIITDFLDYARGKPLALTQVDVGKLLEEVGTLLRKRKEEKQITIVTDVPAGLECVADPELLKQVFLNLGINAIEAASDGGAVTLRGARASGRGTSVVSRGDPAQQPKPEEGVRVEVIDTGPGIDPETKARIGNPFFTTKPRGTGMGMAIVHRLVQAHRGTVEIESALGRGTRVVVWLPRDAAKTAQA